MKAAPALNHLRFAPCTKGFRLLITSPETAGLTGCDDFRPTPMNKMNLSRREICRGKISLPKNQPTSKKGRYQRQINE
jgi:hypothetical protein